MEKLPAALTLVVCIVLLARMMVGQRSRRRMDHAGVAAWNWLRSRAMYAWRWRESRRRAEQEAQEAIRRARRRLEREGNVYRPDAFHEPRKPH